MADFGIRATRPGIDTSSTNVRDFTIDSSYNILKIKESGYGEANISKGVAWTLTVNHALGYKPFSLFYFKHPELTFWIEAPGKADANIDADGGGPGPATYPIVGNIVNTDVNNVTFELYDDNSLSPDPSTAEYKYFILIDPRKDSWYE